MPSVMYEVEDAIGKRKREFNAIDERDIEREKEIQMKLAAASQYTTSPSQIYDAFNRQIFPALSQRSTPPGTKRGRFLPSPKETTTFPGSPTHNTNPFSSLQANLDPFGSSGPLYNTPVASYAGSGLASMVMAQAPPTYNPTTTLHSLHHNIRMINQGITQNQITKSFMSSHLGTNSTYTYSPDAVSKAALMAPKTTMNLNPCHICQRRPLQKKDLEFYADCEGCGERCCWICVRECLGSIYATRTPSPVLQMQPPQVDEDHEMGDGDATFEDRVEQRRFDESKWPAMGGHRSKVCSRCCVEKGKEGEVRCLGCLIAEEQG